MLNKPLKRFGFVMLLLFALIGNDMWAQQFVNIRIRWDANTENDLAGYKVYNGTAPRVYSNVDDVGNVTEFVKPVNSQVKTFFAVSAYDQAGNESGKSEEVAYEPGMAVIDTVLNADSYVCVNLRNSTGFTWRVFGTIGGDTFEVNYLDSAGCVALPVVDDWITVTYNIEIADLSGNVVYTATGTMNVPLTGDFNNDGRVALADLNTFAACYRNDANYKLAADYNRNNTNDLFDFFQFAQRYGRTK